MKMGNRSSFSAPTPSDPFSSRSKSERRRTMQNIRGSMKMKGSVDIRKHSVDVGTIQISSSSSSGIGTLEKPPMPEHADLEKRFTKILTSMNLPPDKAKMLKQYDDVKKWDLICDQDKMLAKEPPSYYLHKLRTYLDPKASKSARKRKLLGDSTSTQVLRDLEISLRTNNIEWVKEFLDEENHGLDALIDYLAYRQVMLRNEQKIQESRGNSEENIAQSQTNNGSTSGFDMSRIKRASRHLAKLKMGEAQDDVHVCIMCLRAIMNNKYGFNMVFGHKEAINCIALSLNHKSLRTKALVLELLAAICLVKGGHAILLDAFDNFKNVVQEQRRFETLMNYFMNCEVFHMEFMSACMQFINIVVHSVEDVNYRVFLQYEFSQLGLDRFLDKMRHTECEELQLQISAYLDNVFDVGALMEDSLTKNGALERVSELEMEISYTLERLKEEENARYEKVMELENRLAELAYENEDLRTREFQISEEVSTLRRVVYQKEEESKRSQTILESKIAELETLNKNLNTLERNVARVKPNTAGDLSGNETTHSLPPPPPPPPLPTADKVAPPPPPPPFGKNPNLPPLGKCIPIPPVPNCGIMTIKRKVEPKYKLPTLNWTVLKPNQVQGTVFNELDDDKLFSIIDFDDFEDKFKIGGTQMTNGNVDESDGFYTFGSKKQKKPETVSLLEHTRLRNIAISRRKLDCSLQVILKAITNLDLNALPLDSVEILQRMVPNDQEIKAYREYERDKKDPNLLTEEDKYLLQLSKVERLGTKLSIMSYICNFEETLQMLSPQVHSIIAAARSVKNSTKFQKLLEIILAFGNYMNGCKRGPAYGFKLQSFDTLAYTKSNDKKWSLLHYIVHTVHVKFPDIKEFDDELKYVEKASSVALENVLTDLAEMEKGMDMLRKEYELRKDIKDEVRNQVLKDFLVTAEDKLKKLKADAKTAQDNFNDVVEYFGENSRTLASNSFFSIFVRLIKSYKQAEADNEQRERANQLTDSSSPELQTQKVKFNPKKQQDAVINELKVKSKMVKEKKLLRQDEVYNGALEDILLGLKNEPYRRADAVRRSQKRNNDRLSRTYDDFEC